MSFETTIDLKFDDPIINKLKENSIVDEVTGCWLWQASKKEKGYGQIRYRYRMVTVHRLSAFLYFMTDISNRKIHICHKEICPNRHCWCPDHIYEGTAQENTADAINFGKFNFVSYKRPVTHCPRGHEYTPENTYYHPKGSKVCKICRYNNDPHSNRDNYKP